MSYGYYPGCSLLGTAKEFEKSLKSVLSVLETETTEIKDWSCCGASSAHAFSHLLSLSLPARNLILAKQQNIKEIVAPCAACYNRLLNTQTKLNANAKLKKAVEESLGMQYSNGIQILNLIELFQKIGLDKLKEKTKISLNGLKVACYYGCLLLRPNDLTHFDDQEIPNSMENIIKAIGGVPVEWNYKTDCCGAAHSIDRTDIVEELGAKIIKNAKLHGADVIVTACPMCHSNLDMRQLNMMHDNYLIETLPVFYLSELMGLAMGIDYKELGIDLHSINANPVLDKLSIKEATK